MANIDLSKLKKEHLVLIYIILFVAIAFAAYKNVFNPMRGKIKEVSAQIEQRKGNIQKAKVSPEVLENLEAEIDRLNTQIGYYQQSLQASADVPQILGELNQMAERLNVKIVSVNPLERKETILPGGEGVLTQIPIRLKLQCGYHGLGIFINQIENSSRFMKITQLKIGAEAKSIWEHQAELVITSYRLVSK